MVLWEYLQKYKSSQIWKKSSLKKRHQLLKLVQQMDEIESYHILTGAELGNNQLSPHPKGIDNTLLNAMHSVEFVLFVPIMYNNKSDNMVA